MKTIFQIAKTELQTLFYSPVAWLITIIFTFQISLAFGGALESYMRFFAVGFRPSGLSSNIFAGMSGVFTHVQQYLYLYIPLLTMGLMSREYSSGSIKLLYSSPINNTQIILGKYLSMVLYGLVLVAILMVFVIFGSYVIKDFEMGAVLSGLLGIYLLLCAYAAIGLFMSSLTSYQIVAAMGTFVVLAILNYVGGLWQEVAFVRDITYWLSISGRSSWMIQGLICSEDVLYFILVTTLFLSLAIFRLHSNRQKTPWTASIGKYIAVFCLIALGGYVTSRPTMKTFYDATSTKSNTLTPNSQEVVRQMEGGVTITTYTNALDEENLPLAIPRSVNQDLSRFTQYTRFKPEIKMKYVYYYDSVVSPSLDKRYPDLDNRQRAEKITDAYDLKMNMFLTPEEIRGQIDLSGEGNIFVREVTRASGEKTFLRVFNDMQKLPGETEITAAFKRLVMKLPKVGFLTGHGERNRNREGDRNYNQFAQEKPFRYALINQGFDIEDVRLKKDIPDDITILVIADMREPLTDTEQLYLDRYIARGGNLLVLGEPRRQEAMNPIIEQLGVSFTPGTLVTQSENFLANFILSSATREASQIAYHFSSMFSREQVVTMPSAVGLDYSAASGFDVIPLFVSDSTAWNEVETSNFLDDTVSYNPAAGEIQQPFVTGLAMSRTVGDKMQKIIILGDADCISNAEINMRRQNVPAANFTLITGTFYWLSDEEVPIDVRRPPLPDDQLYLDKAGVKMTKTVFTWAFSGLLALIAVVIWLRRRGR